MPKKRKGPKYPGLVARTFGHEPSISFRKAMDPFVAEGESITEALIQELTARPGTHLTREVLEEFKDDGMEYVRTRDTFRSPVEVDFDEGIDDEDDDVR